MKFGFPWRVKGIRQDARRTAQEAARRAGMPLSDWLNAIILQQAATQGIRMPTFTRARDEGAPDHLTDGHYRIDNLARRIDQVTRRETVAYAPKRDREAPDQIAEQFARHEQGFEQFSTNVAPPASATMATHTPTIEAAIAEITARRRSLNSEAVPVQAQQSIPAVVSPPTHTPALDLSGLESQLRHIADQIETLRRPGTEEEIAAFRGELHAIGRTIEEAVPRRAIEALETQVQRLAGLIADGREGGAYSSAVAVIEQGLAEVRDTLRALMAAENLAGFTEAIDALAKKIDRIAVQSDPVAIEQLENSIGSLRDITATVASNETVNGLAAQVQMLADKIDRLSIGGGGDTLNRLELRIDALSRVLTDRTPGGDAIPPHLEALIQSLSEKIEQLQQVGGERIAIDHLEDRIVKLFERLDATDSRLSHLDAIERGLTDLLVHIEEIRTDKAIAERRAEDPLEVDLLKQGMARAQDALAAVNSTLDRVAERLTLVENDIRSYRTVPTPGETKILELLQPSIISIAQDAPAAAETAPPALSNLPSASVSAKATQPASPLSADFPNMGLRPAVPLPDLPADRPLEPGSGRPGAATSPSMRIAASEAALGGVHPNLNPAAGKSNFIAAARRAAQAASQDAKGRRARPETIKGRENRSLRSNVAARVKTMFLAASIVAIIVGSIQFATNIFDFGLFDRYEAKVTETDSATSEIGAVADETETSTALAESPPASPEVPAEADLVASLLAPPSLPGSTPAGPPPTALAAPPQMQSNQVPSTLTSASQVWSAFGPPALSVPIPGTAPAPKSDVTGAIARAPADSRANRQPAQGVQPPTADGLPDSIGSTRLRDAALAGDPTAAYEVAMRFVEGRGVPANLEEAARWFERAASKGLTPAQFRYASMLEKGQGVKKDLAAARKLYVSAAGKGHAKAMHNLAVLYAEGADGTPDYVNAAQWFRKAAEHGIADSQYNLGVLTARGLGTEKNLADSYKWFALAAAQGDRDAGRKRDEIAAYLNAEALATAQAVIKSFTPRPQPTEATAVQPPPGGWDRTTSQAQEKRRVGG